jgi:predicted ABC-type ATPase
MCKFNGYKKIALVFNVDVEEACRRVREDIESGKNRSNVPEKVIRKQYKNFCSGLKSLEHEFNEVRVIE